MAEQYTGVKFKTLFEGVDFGCAKEREAIVAEIKKLGRMGLLDRQNGNISVKVKEGMVITPAAKYLAEMEPKDMVLVKGLAAGRGIVKAVGTSSPSSEARLHWMIYESFPKAGAVVHFHDAKLLGSGRFPETEKEHPYGTLELAEEVLKTLKRAKKDFIIMKSHGAVAVGKDLDSCQKLVEKAEKAKK